MKRFMQKLEKSNGKYSNAQSLHQKYLKIARYSCAIFNTNLAHCCISEPNILNRTQVNKYLALPCLFGLRLLVLLWFPYLQSGVFGGWFRTKD